MQAIELNNPTDNNLTLIIVFAIVLIAVLKLLNSNELSEYTIAFFNLGFFQKKSDTAFNLFTPFQFILTVFSCIVLSLIFYTCFQNFIFYQNDFTGFLKIFTFVFCYLFFRYFLDIIIVSILAIKKSISYFLHIKYGYLFSLCLLVFPAVIINIYSLKGTVFLLSVFIVLLVFRMLLILFNNKKLLVSKLFYFILYLCALEIAPLLILYKILYKTTIT
ncbi:MAG: DUF4271 domain-containing protein [Tenacibaculum sp.]